MLPEVPARRAFSIEALEMTENENVYVARVQHDNTLVSACPTILPCHVAVRSSQAGRPLHANLELLHVACTSNPYSL